MAERHENQVRPVNRSHDRVHVKEARMMVGAGLSVKHPYFDDEETETVDG